MWQLASTRKGQKGLMSISKGGEEAYCHLVAKFPNCSIRPFREEIVTLNVPIWFGPVKVFFFFFFFNHQRREMIPVIPFMLLLHFPLPSYFSWRKDCVHIYSALLLVLGQSNWILRSVWYVPRRFTGKRSWFSCPWTSLPRPQPSHCHLVLTIAIDL